MVDVHDRITRSRNMAAIKNKNTRPELLVRKALHQAGFRYRLHVTTLPGKPDLVFPKYKAVVFIHGCFWHQHQCPQFHWPKSRTAWWQSKITANRVHDEFVQDKLRELGWRVLLVWECALKGKARYDRAELVRLASNWIVAGSCFSELPASC